MTLSIARRELILGGQKSGKSRRAELLARDWLAAAPLQGEPRRATLLATGQPWDDEMRQRIARHQSDRAARAPGLLTLEVPHDLAAAVRTHSAPHHLLVVDCLTLWLTQCTMPMGFENLDLKQKEALVGEFSALSAHFLDALEAAPGPVVLVGNEIGLGVIPLGPQVRAFVDALGLLNQQVAQRCTRVTLMVAGLPLNLKDAET